MKGYMYLGDDLGQDIYDFLYPYFNSDILDEADGGYIGTIEDDIAIICQFLFWMCAV